MTWRVSSTCFQGKKKSCAGRFYFERDRRRYIIGRGTLRRLLGGYLGVEPAQGGDRNPGAW